MPIFEYVCKKCGREFEKLMRADLAIECPACASSNVDKKFSLFACAGGLSGASPECGDACNGFERGSCGSGMCGGHGHAHD